jgi:hypothetical protein
VYLFKYNILAFKILINLLFTYFNLPNWFNIKIGKQALFYFFKVE